uniref:Zn-finger protein n=1 Tax=Pithovirus LCPAC403 TaxID=2506596 RepID=A0A481ZBL2_9VIRU|nr:MAG: Zn-finger protein [Pithovirus LCPAC403]
MSAFCFGITEERKRCMRYGSNEGLCHQHTNQNLTIEDWVDYWSIINHDEVIVLPELQYDKYISEKYKESLSYPHYLYKGHSTYLTRELSPIKINVLNDLINKFIGIDYVWIAINEVHWIPTVDVVGMDCKHELKNASIYCVKIGKVYKRCHLESQKIIT